MYEIKFTIDLYELSDIIMREHLFCKKGGSKLNQYIEYQKNQIIKKLPHITDIELLQLIYGLVMEHEESNQEEYPSAS